MTWAWCAHCGRLVEYDKVLPAVECPQCGRKRQRFKYAPTPIRPQEDRSYRVEWNDVRFLEKIGIDPEVPEAS